MIIIQWLDAPSVRYTYYTIPYSNVLASSSLDFCWLKWWYIAFGAREVDTEPWQHCDETTHVPVA